MKTQRITDTQIRALRNEAGETGDLEQIEICDRALSGDEDAREECARVIADADVRGAVAGRTDPASAMRCFECKRGPLPGEDWDVICPDCEADRDRERGDYE